MECYIDIQLFFKVVAIQFFTFSEPWDQYELFQQTHPGLVKVTLSIFHSKTTILIITITPLGHFNTAHNVTISSNNFTINASRYLFFLFCYKKIAG